MPESWRMVRIWGAVPPRAAKILTGDREIGFVTSAAQSPRLLAERAGDGTVLLGEGSDGVGGGHESVDGRDAEILSAGFENDAPAARPG